MSHQKKLSSSITCQNNLYEDEQTRVHSNAPSPKEDIEDTLFQSLKTKTPNQTERKSSMLVFRRGNTKETLVDRQSISKQNTQTIESSPILEAESILEEKVSDVYFKEFSSELSRKLWLPIETASQGLDLKCLNGFSKNTTHSSFQIKPTIKMGEMNSQKTSCPSSLCSRPDITVEENINYCRKIRIYPSKQLKELLEKCFRATRYVQNQALEYIEKHPQTSL